MSKNTKQLDNNDLLTVGKLIKILKTYKKSIIIHSGLCDEIGHITHFAPPAVLGDENILFIGYDKSMLISMEELEFKYK